MTEDLNPEQSKLANLMSTISEKCYCAQWMINLEYVLWDAVVNGERKYGRSMTTTHDIQQLLKLSQSCNSWISFDDQKGETAINLDTWKIMLDKTIEPNPTLKQY